MNRGFATIAAMLVTGCIEYEVVDEIGAEYEPNEEQEHIFDGMTRPESKEPILEKEKADVLFVIDNSCSMHSDLDYISYGLYQIPDELNQNNIDWKIAIISMDPHDDLFIEVPYSESPNWDMFDAVSNFRDNALGGESGFSSALRALDIHSDFFREDSKDFIIFASDERDKSFIPPEQFHSLWDRDHYIASIAGPKDIDDYVNHTCFVDITPNYNNVADEFVSICTQTRWSVVPGFASSL